MPSLLDDGVYPDVDRDRYDGIERTNFSKLKWMARTPEHYHHELIAPPFDTDMMKVGRVVHLAVFEPERFQRGIAVWDEGTRRGKVWDAFKVQHEGKELLTLAEYEKCVAIQRKVRNHPAAMRYLSGGKGEISLLWSAHVGKDSIACKGRIDFDARDALVDLKTTKDGEQEAFGRQAFNLHYYVQAAWYADAYQLLSGIRRPYVIVAVESVEPYVVQVYRVPDIAIALGREKYRVWLDRLAYCRANNVWPGYTDNEELDLTLPRWAYPEGSDPTGLGLKIGGE